MSYQQPPYQPPYPPPYPPPPPPQSSQNDGMSVAALVLGICSLVFMFLSIVLPFVSVAAGILSIILGVLGRKRQMEKGLPAGMAVAGMVMGIVGLSLGLIFSLVCFVPICSAACAATNALNEISRWAY